MKNKGMKSLRLLDSLPLHMSMSVLSLYITVFYRQFKGRHSWQVSQSLSLPTLGCGEGGWSQVSRVRSYAEFQGDEAGASGPLYYLLYCTSQIILNFQMMSTGVSYKYSCGSSSAKPKAEVGVHQLIPVHWLDGRHLTCLQLSDIFPMVKRAQMCTGSLHHYI
jgi:hypothetical protein